LIGVAAMIEMVYHLQLNQALGSTCISCGDPGRQEPRQLVRLVFRGARGSRNVRNVSSGLRSPMGEIQGEIEKEIRRRETL